MWRVPTVRKVPTMRRILPMKRDPTMRRVQTVSYVSQLGKSVWGAGLEGVALLKEVCHSGV